MRLEIALSVVDWEELHSLLVSAYAYMDDRIDPPTSLRTMTPADLRRKAADETLIVAKSDGVPVGC